MDVLLMLIVLGGLGSGGYFGWKYLAARYTLTKKTPPPSSGS